MTQATFSERAAQLQKARRALRREFGKCEVDGVDDVARQLLRLVLMEEATASAVQDAERRIDAAFVDLNELRVSLAKEIAEVMPRMPHAEEKAARLVRLFNAMFLKHNTMDWSFVRTLGVRDLRQYVERVDGGGPVLAAAAVLLFTDGHAVPADADVRRVLSRLELIEPQDDAATVQTFLERAVKSDEGLETWALFRRLAEDLCTVKNPVCPKCPLKSQCPTGKARIATKAKTPKSTKTDAGAKRAATAKSAGKTAAKAKAKSKTAAKKTAPKKKAAAKKSTTKSKTAKKKTVTSKKTAAAKTSKTPKKKSAARKK